MIIALTGSSGSIGKELFPFLEDLNHKVIQISSSAVGNGENIFSYDDINNQNINLSIDIVIHLASLNSNLQQCDIKKEVEITKNILTFMQAINCKKIIFFSSAKVYGDNGFEQTIYNESSVLKPICSYGKAKKECEELIENYCAEFNMHFIVLRLPPAITTNSNSNLSKLLKLSAKGFYMPTFSAGDFNLRSFISIINIKITIDHILKNIKLIERNQIYNLSDKNSISLNQLLGIVNSKNLIRLPSMLFYFMIKIPPFKREVVKLFGSFMLDNSKLTNDMNITLASTLESLPINFK
ncbi:NAD-dependent epimerase/dehydratase family protein [Gammaproteobacteria bacterium]|jgi:UDP-glucose 4-epimerase|nr:NAD-dependent epimerase/dehydratase family protein [Gammaproteobacteria bacterium]